MSSTMDITGEDSKDVQLLDFLKQLQQQLEQQSQEMKKQSKIIHNLQQHANSTTQALKEARQSKPTTLEPTPATIGLPQTKDTQERLPKLDKFKGDRTMWDEWHLGALHKLSRDGVALGSPFDQFMYIYSRLDGDAIKMVSATARTLSENGEGTGVDFLEYLNTVFGYPNKKARAERELYQMKQKEKEPFPDFLSKFETVLANAGWSSYSDRQKISLLKNALTKELQLVLLGSSKNTWAEFVSYVHTIYSDKEAIDQINPPFSLPATKIRQQNSSENSNTSKMDWEPTKSTFIANTQGQKNQRASWVTKDVLAFRKKKGLCVRCGYKGHIVPNCNYLPPLKPVNINLAKLTEEEEVELVRMAQPEGLKGREGKEELLY